jgi:cbb3-type cytochrome oxidase cytochrome c subunit
MNQGPIIFLGVFFALVCSWFGLIVQPQLQIGAAQPVPDLYNPDVTHPHPRAGLAQRGLQVYNSLGCAACHTQQLQQQATVFDVVLAQPGTNVADVIKAVLKLRPDLTAPEAAKLVERAPVQILRHVADLKRLEFATSTLSTGDAKIETHIIPVGPDMARGWGVARSVGSDYLHDYPVMLGSQRIGPDLANVGSWLRTPEWHLQHLYDPTSVVPKSVMPPYKFLFEKRLRPFRAAPVTLARQADSPLSIIAGTRTNWTLPDQIEPVIEPESTEDHEIVPSEDAVALVAYLLSLRADTPILERPIDGAPPEPATEGNATNALAAPSQSSTVP